MKIFLIISKRDNKYTMEDLSIINNNLEIIDIVESENYKESVWLSIVKCVGTAITNSYPNIAICTNPKSLTTIGSTSNLRAHIDLAKNYNTKILLLNAERARTILPVTPQLYWIDYFRGCDFFVLFESFYRNIIDLKCDNYTQIEYVISEATSNKLILFPMLESDTKENDLKKRMIRIHNKFESTFKKNF